MRANINVSTRPKERKSYFPFINGMRGQLFVNGSAYQLNIKQEQGYLEKLKQSSLYVDIPDFDSIVYVAPFQGVSGGYQALVFGYVGANIKLRAIEGDGTVTTPTGGAGDYTFTGTVTVRQVGSKAIICDASGAKFWDGTLISSEDLGKQNVLGTITGILDYSGTVAGTVLVSSLSHGLETGDSITISGTTDYNGVYTVTVTSLNDFYITDTFTSNQTGEWVYVEHFNITSCARDGSRIGFVTADGKAKFSDASPFNGFAIESGANANGDYNIGIPRATAIVEGGTGVVIFGEEVAEAHWVQPNNASDEVSSRTKIESFNYKGRGVTNERFVCATDSSVIFMNEDGIFEMNPYSGQVVNLIEGGKIERYWDEQVDMSNGFVCYDTKNELIVAQVALDSPQNNVLIVFNAGDKEKPPFFADNHFLNHASVVNGGLVGGSNSSGETRSLFYSHTLSSGRQSKARYITEFDGLGEIHSEKNLFAITGIIEVSPEANMTIRAYFDNETTPTLEKVFTASDLTFSDGTAPYGEYVFALGASDIVQENVIDGERGKNGKAFKTIAIEIIEESSANFKIYDIIIEYKRRRGLSKTLSLKNNLF